MISAALLSMCISGVQLHEGFRHHAYKDRNGYSIGFGYSLTQNPLNLSHSQIKSLYKGISKGQAINLVRRSCVNLDTQLAENLDWYNTATLNTKYVLLDMSYNMGVGGVIDFTKTINYLEHHKYKLASVEMLKSKWANQVHGRAKELATLIKS